ncbi:hypothetical protein PO467_00095 [Enterobacter kobei]|uniref:hypothetical protein n=1 Tax=Enterobacteriaceae TaxID=543 RepID=UPI001D0DB69A|nr:hypothetical protein [Klebsiella pneumoniae]
MIEKVTALTATQNEPEKIDPEEQLPDQPDPELPDLTRLYKRRCRDGDVMQKCKHMLIAGYSPGRVALLLRLPLEKVKELHQASYNPRCRRFANPNNGKIIITMWHEGATLVEVCQTLGLPLFTVVMSLRGDGVTNAALVQRHEVTLAELTRVKRAALEKANKPQQRARPRRPDLESHRPFTIPARCMAGVSLRP